MRISKKLKDNKRIKHSIVVAFTLAVLTAILCVIINRGQFFYSTNDDYYISTILANGETRLLYLNYLFSAFLSILYRLIPSVNWFVVIQIVFNIVGLTCFNYVMIKRFNRILAIGFILSYSILFINQAVSIIQWTQTATILITAGFLLLFYALLWNHKGSWFVLQMITSAVLVLLGSLVRFTSLYPVLLIFAVGLILYEVISTLKGNAKNYKDTVKRVCKEILMIILICSVCFLSNALSNSLVFSGKEWQDYREYNQARSNVVDYYHAPYEGNEDFYNSKDIYSEKDLKVGVFTADNTFFSTSKLKSIGEYSESVGYGDRFIITELSSKLTGNRLYILLGLCVILVGFAIILFKFRNRIELVFPVLLIGLYIAYFIIFKLHYIYILALPLLVYVVITGFVCNRYHFIYLSILSVLCLSIIVAMNFLRLSFRVAFNVFFPTIILLYNLFDVNNLRCNIVLHKRAIIKRFGVIGFAVVLIVNFLTCLMISRSEQNWINERTNVSDYISDHAETLFVTEKVDICPSYNVPLSSPRIKHENLISYGWKVGSPEYQSRLEQFDAVNLYKAMIDNPEIKLIIKDKDRAMYEEYFNAHYTKHVVFETEAEFDGVSVLAVTEGEG